MFLVGPVRTPVDGVRYGCGLSRSTASSGRRARPGAALAFRAVRPSDLRQLALLPLLIIPIGLVRLLLSLALGGLAGSLPIVRPVVHLRIFAASCEEAASPEPLTSIAIFPLACPSPM